MSLAGIRASCLDMVLQVGTGRLAGRLRGACGPLELVGVIEPEGEHKLAVFQPPGSLLSIPLWL